MSREELLDTSNEKLKYSEHEAAQYFIDTIDNLVANNRHLLSQPALEREQPTSTINAHLKSPRGLERRIEIKYDEAGQRKVTATLYSGASSYDSSGVAFTVNPEQGLVTEQYKHQSGPYRSLIEASFDNIFDTLYTPPHRVYAVIREFEAAEVTQLDIFNPEILN